MSKLSFKRKVSTRWRKLRQAANVLETHQLHFLANDGDRFTVANVDDVFKMLPEKRKCEMRKMK